MKPIRVYVTENLTAHRLLGTTGRGSRKILVARGTRGTLENYRANTCSLVSFDPNKASGYRDLWIANRYLEVVHEA